MKEEILNNLTGIIEYIKQGADFVKEQAPLFIQEYLTFKMYLFMFWEVALVIIAIVSAWGCRKCYYKTQEDFADDGWGFLMVVLGLAVIVSIVGFVVSTEELMKIIFAPRVFLVEHLLSLCGK